MVNSYVVHSFSALCHFLTTVRRFLSVSDGWLVLGVWLAVGLGTAIGQDQPTPTPARRGRTGQRQQVAADSARAESRRRATMRADSVKQAVKDRTDSIRAVRSANRRPTVNWPDRRATRFSERTSQSPFILRDPKGVSTDFRLGPDGRIAVTERVRSGVSLSGAPALNNVQGNSGNVPAPQPGVPALPDATPAGTPIPGLALPPSQFGMPYRPAETIPYSTYNRLQNQRVEQNLWREFGARRDGQSAVSGRGLIPKLELPPIVDRLFGGSTVDFKPNGFVTLDFGYLYQFLDSPVIPVRQRRQGNFLFNEQISINFNGKVGERLGVLANFDTKASFNFENALKVNYKPGGGLPGLGTGQGLPNLPSAPNLPGVNGQTPGLPGFTPQNESILQGLEVGNINWAVNSQLIPGVQNLFGIKTQLRFGKLNATAVVSQQRSRKSEITLRGGTSNRPFEIRADQYDENRHFFLSQFFRSIYEGSLRSLPQVTSGVNVTRIEVYVTNRTNTTETLRNLAGFQDLGEGNPYAQANPTLLPFQRNNRTPADNRANGLYDKLISNPSNPFRQVDRASEVLTTTYGLTKGTDFDLLRGAKRLTEREFKLQPELGYISLVTPLRNDEILAVSYEYTYQGRRYKVGELTEDYQARDDDEVLVLKLLKSATLRNNLQLPMWNLMMKNIYSLNTAQITRQGFQLRIVYKDDLTGVDNPNLQESSLRNVPLVQVFNMDRLNQQLDAQPDGNFDFVENITVDSRYGKIIFPVLEPFGSYLNSKFGPGDDGSIRAKYLFNELYRTTLADAQQIADKNKFFLRGAFQSGNGAEVQLPYGVNEQSVTVTAGGVPLSPGTDYVLEAQTGRLRIINESVTNSGREIKISYEQPDLFQNQIRTLIGTRLDYALSRDVSLGLTAMHMKETPAGFLTRVAIGNEPVNNTILGLSANIRKDAPGLTRLLDALPMLQTKEPSTVQFNAEVAQLFPGTNPRARNDSYLDDFEAARTIFDLTRQPTRWRLGATPQQFPQGTFQNPLEFAYNRAQISVYSVDPSLYTPGSQGVTSNVDPDEVKGYAYERFFLPQDLFPGRSTRVVQLPESILDVSYFPAERGMYNYNPNLNADGTLPNPRRNFGSVTRAIASDIDFDNANIENITFWLMDPFVKGRFGTVRGSADDSKNTPNTTGGKLVFNLGDISEDVIKDGRYTFENGFPADGDTMGVNSRNGGTEPTIWGRAPRQQFVTNAFQSGGRENQDIGLEGLRNDAETTRFQPYLNAVRARVTDPNVLEDITQDPSGDDFRFYLGDEADRQKYIVARYKRYMGMENNSPENTSTNAFLTPASTTLPDIEDLNIDNTVNDNEAYYEYEIDLRPDRLDVGQNKYIVDKVVVPPADGVGVPVTWYQFRIPVREPLRKVGSINGFKSIRFARMYLTDFEQPVVLRFAQLQMEANQYRKYLGDLNQRGLQEVPEPYDADFTVSTVNIEENSQQQVSPTGGGKYVYSVPPGYVRDRDFTQVNQVELNEQSMRLSVTNLRDGDSRGAFRNTNIDLQFRERIKMFIHMHNTDNESGQVGAFVRLGTDYTENYYEIEIGELVATADGNRTPEEVWPAANELDLALSELINLKAERNRNFTRRSSLPYTITSANGRYRLTVVGNPDLSSVQSIMIGVRNPKSSDERPKTFTIWVNELRANGYDQQAGVAGIAALNMKLADLATVTASGRITTFGFGGVQTKIGERARETTSEFGVSSAIAIDKFLPEKWGFRIPLYVNYDTRNVDPHFNPLDPDTPLETSLTTLSEGAERDRYRKLVQDNTTRRGYNFSNVRKVKTNPSAKAHFWDFENLAFTYAFNDTKRTNILTDEYLQQQYRGGIAYTFGAQPKAFEPFRNKASFDAPYLRWLKDFNLTLLPSLVSIRTDMDRSFIKTQLRSSDLTTDGITPQYEKYFLFNRYYDLTWNLTRSLVLTYRAQANSIIDEPAGDINTQSKRDSIVNSIRNLGRMKNFVQDIRATYRLPLDKIPLLDWLAADAIYGIGYQFQANSFGIADTLGVPFGNILRNNRERGITGRVDLIRLYNKIRYLRFVNTPAPVRKNFARNPGDVEDIVRGESKILKNFTRALLTVRGINFSYTVQESTILPGFLPTPRFFGLDENNAPGLGFVLGSQNRSIQYKAAERGWLTPSTVLNTAFQQNLTKKFNARTTLEPFKDFRMQVEWRLDRTDAYQEYFRPGAQGGPFETQSPVRNGQFSMSFWSFRTAFVGLRGDNSSPLFDRFESYRQFFINKLTQSNPEKGGGYNKTSQDVLIPAFFAAYSGQDSAKLDKTKLNPFFNFPLPNWRIDYNGLSGLAFIRNRFSAFTVTHSYTSNYSVGNFISNLEYGAAYVNLAVQGYPMANRINQQGQFVPVFAMSTITMSEKFAPMLGVQFQTKNRITGRLEYNQSRDVALSLSNSQVAELTNKDLTASVGFTRQNVRIPFRINGAYKKLKNDLTFSCNLTLRDTRAIQRKLDDEYIITAGNVNFQLRPQVSYIVSRRLNFNLYFDRTFNDPLVSNSFRRATTAGGVQVKFNLAE
ncbi:T9SS outer membrane translocon Sov/SprA [Spirosoma arcticum]